MRVRASRPPMLAPGAVSRWEGKRRAWLPAPEDFAALFLHPAVHAPGPQPRCAGCCGRLTPFLSAEAVVTRIGGLCLAVLLSAGLCCCIDVGVLCASLQFVIFCLS